MELIVDIQGFRRPFNNTFTLKELAIISIYSEASPSMFFFKPPYEWDCLDVKYKSQNSWLERDFHGLPWSCGTIPFEEVEWTIEDRLCKAETVYVKGEEKRDWLLKIVPKVQIIDMLDFDCPSLQTLQKTSAVSLRCDVHTIPNAICAAQNVLILQNWLQNHHTVRMARVYDLCYCAEASTRTVPHSWRIYHPGYDTVE